MASQDVGARPTWSRLSECPRCVAYRPNLRRTGVTALVVGVALFLINHLDAVLGGRAGTAAWVGTGLSFVVPFCVANLGVLAASRRAGPAPRPGGAPPAGNEPPSWHGARELVACVVHRPHLRRTVAIALVVGTVYFALNHLTTVVAGRATTQVWVSGAITYLVPFSVANTGLLVATKRVVPSSS